MTLKRLLPILALAGLFAGCAPDTVIGNHEDVLTVSPSSQKISAGGTASFTFSFKLLKPSNDKVKELVNLKETKTTATIKFEATGGTVSPASATTDENGQVSVTFTATDLENFTGGTVKGIVKNVKGIVDQQGDLATATAQVLPLDAEPVTGNIKKAYDLKDNVVVIQKKGGTAESFNYKQNLSSWSMEDSDIYIYMDQDEDSAQGMMWGLFPASSIGTNTAITPEFLQKNPHLKMGFERYAAGINGSAYGGEGAKDSNIKTDGNSSFWIMRGTPTKDAWHGTYIFMFYIEFQNRTYDHEKDQWVYGDEYVVYGKGVIEEYIPHITSFSLKTETDFIKPGQSAKVLLENYYDKEATWDWSDVQLVGQATEYDDAQNGANQGYVSWDAATQTLTGLKAYHNTYPLYLKFALKSNPSVGFMLYTLSCGEGWPYTSFSLSPEFQLVSPGSSSANMSVTWAPSSESWDPAAIEIDPSSNQNGNFKYIGNKYYGTYGTLYLWASKPVYGTEHLVFRLKSDHNVKATMQLRVVKVKLESFQITYLHNNSYISEGEHGVCNYGMGLPLGVITTPEDADWNWSDVELASNQDTFSFSGVGGRDDHPKLMLNKSHDGTYYGAQVIFRLKWDHSMTSTIYVDHN